MQHARLLGHLRVSHGNSSGFSWCFLRRANTKQSNWYSILGIKFNAEQKEIKKSFYKLSKEFHPDLNKDDEASLMKFKEIAEAYEILSSPERRKEYDQYMGFGIKRDHFENGDGNSELRGDRRRFTGMKGVFRDGKFVDDEPPPQMRNIEYDLSPERMEKLWGRYKARWDRFDEVERVRELEKKKVEFRRRVDLKREKMDQMSEDEKADFLYKLRLLRTDVGEDSDEDCIKKEGETNSRTIDMQEEERKQKVQNEKQKSKVEQEEKEKRREYEEKRRLERKLMREQEKKVMIEQLGLTEERYNQIMDEERQLKTSQGHARERDVFYDGLDSSKDAADWRSMMGRTYESNKEKWERVKEGRNNMNNSPKHGVHIGLEKKFGVILVLTVVCSSVVLFSSEFSNRDFDK